MELREVWTKYVDLGVTRVQMIFIAMKLDEIIKKVGVARKRKV